MPITLKEAVIRNNNNFDLVRLLASLSVIYGHAFYLFNNNGEQDLVRKYCGVDSGSASVYLFFFLSGMFISASYIKSNSWKKYTLMRMFRIWPALIVCIVLTVFVIGPIFTTINLANYFGSKQTWLFFFKNITLIKFEPHLPGVFEHNHFNGSVNGSLWTLPNEMRCYLMVLLIGLTGLLNRKFIPLTIFILFGTLFYVLNALLIGQIGQVVFFTAGMAAYSFKEYILVDVKIAIVLILLTILFKYFVPSIFFVAFFTSLIYSSLVFGTAKFSLKFKLSGDFSYGLYIYGFLIQQIIASLYPKIQSLESIIITIPIVLFISIWSWYIVELPLINYGKKLAKIVK